MKRKPKVDPTVSRPPSWEDRLPPYTPDLVEVIDDERLNREWIENPTDAERLAVIRDVVTRLAPVNPAAGPVFPTPPTEG